MSTSPTIALLAGAEDYAVWARSMETVLIKEKLWPVVEKGPHVVPATSGAADIKPSKDSEEYLRSASNNRLAAGTIFLYLSTPLKTKYVGVSDAKSLWNKLERDFTSTTNASVSTLLYEMINAKYEGSVRTLLTNHMMTKSRLLQLKLTPDDLLDQMVINKLPQDMGYMYQDMLNKKKPGVALDLDEVIKRCEEHEIRKKVQEHEEATAYAAKSKAGRSGRKDQVCAYCNKTGHSADFCFKNPSSNSFKGNGGNKDGKNNDKSDKGKGRDLIERQVVNLLTEVALRATAKRTPSSDSNEFFIDSGASRHIVYDADLLELTGKPTIAGFSTANGELLPCTDVGTLQLVIDSVSITLVDVHVVPAASVNLISVMQLNRSGIEVHLKDAQAHVYVDDDWMVSFKRTGDNFTVRGKAVTSVQALSLTPRSFQTYTARQLHAVMGHTRIQTLVDAIRKGNLQGLAITGSQELFCDVCATTKQHAGFHQGSIKPAERLLDVIHSDTNDFGVCDAYGYRYIVSFIDGYSRLVYARCLKSKTKTLAAFKEFYACTVERNPDIRINEFHCDNGTEYTNTAFREFLAEKKIAFTTSSVGTPQENSIAERWNRTLNEKTRTLLADSGLDTKRFWSLAARASVWLHNRTPQVGLDHETPHFKWTGKVPDLHRCVPFGTVVYVQITGRTAKTEPNGRQYIVVGMTLDGLKYLLLDPASTKIHKVASITYDGSFPVVVGENSSAKGDEHIVAPPTDFPDYSDDERDDCMTRDQQELTSALDEDESFEDTFDLNHQVGDGVGAAMDSDDNVNTGSARSAPLGLPAEDITHAPSQANIERTRSKWHDPAAVSADNIIACGRRPAAEKAAGGISNALSLKELHGIGELIALSTCDGPPTFSAAMKSNDADEWKKAVQAELNSITANNVWEVVPRPAGSKPLSTRWVLVIKYNGDGMLERYKARLVIRGFEQREGIDYDHTFAPVVRMTSVRTIIAIAASKNLLVHQMDVTTAFLHGDIDRELYIEPPQGTGIPNGYVCKLKKSLYGLKQAPRIWNETINSFLADKGFSRSAADFSVYYRHTSVGEVFLTIYVDDLLIAATNDTLIREVKALLSGHFAMKDMGVLKYILGIEVSRSDDGGYFLCQSDYLNSVLERFGMADAHSVATPMETGYKPHKAHDNEDTTDKPYANAVGALMYLSNCTRPDISYAVNSLASFNAKPTEYHWAGVKRVLRYLAGTRTYGIWAWAGAPLELSAFSDSDFACDEDTRRSTTGYLMLLGGCPISWMSRKQKTIAQSTTEAEYMAIGEAGREIRWMHKLLESVGIRARTTTLRCDNQAAIEWASNPVDHDRAKHIDVKYHIIREWLGRRVLKITYLPTTEMLADFLTKPVSKDVLIKIVKSIRLEDPQNGEC